MNKYHPIIPSAESFLFPGSKAGMLLVHGFTGTPKEMRTMGEFFASEGYFVLGIRLPGHATNLADMPHLRWTDWLHAVEDGYHLLHSTGLPVFVMGLSMGGILSLTAAARLPITGVVAMSTPYQLSKDPRLPYVQYISWLIPTAPKGPSDWRDQAMLQGHVEYPVYPTRSLAELRDLAQAMRNSLSDITCPVLLVHSRADAGVPPENMELIFARLGSSKKSMLWLEKSGHVLTGDVEHERVFEAALKFVQQSLE